MIRIFVAFLILGITSCSSGPFNIPQHSPTSNKPNPQIMGHDPFEDSTEANKQQLPLSNMSIDISILGTTAQTTIEMTIDNPYEEEIEGLLKFQLPNDTIVNGYALDIEGVMVDGVLLEKEKSERVYSSVVRGKVDPGIAKITSENIFENKIYPIPEGGSRTVSLSFATRLNENNVYQLPLNFINPIKKTSLNIKVNGSKLAPKALLTLGPRIFFEKTGEGWSSSTTYLDRNLKHDLAIEVHKPNDVIVARNNKGDYYFEIKGKLPKLKSKKRIINSMRVYWDASLSRDNQNHDKEIELLAKSIEALKPNSIELVIMRETRESKLYTSYRSLLTDLKNIIYDGATNLNASFSDPPNSADICFLFTDGLSVLDIHKSRYPRCPNITVASTHSTNRGYLRMSAAMTGGEFIDIQKYSIASQLANITQSSKNNFYVSGMNSLPDDIMKLETASNYFHVIGKLKNPADTMTIKFHTTKKTRDEKKYYLTREDAISNKSLSAFWAREHIERVNAEFDTDETFTIKASQKYGIATDKTAYLVLENVEQYVENNIEIPFNFSKTQQKKYWALRKQKETNALRARENWIGNVVSAWQEKKDWWSGKLIPELKKTEQPETVAPRSQQGSQTWGFSPTSEGVEIDVTDLMESAPTERKLTSVTLLAPSQEPQVEEIVVTAQKRKTSDSADVEITIRQWTPDRPYIKALEKAGDEKFTTTYLNHRKEYGTTPGFYFDIADFLHKGGNNTKAISMALNVLELQTIDSSTKQLLASKLTRYGENQLSIQILKSLHNEFKDNVQITRKLALAHALYAEEIEDEEKLNHYARSMSLFCEALEFNESINDAERVLIQLMEANNIFAKLPVNHEAGACLPHDLKALLDTDLRIVIEWNTDASDMDLWVVEPSGKKTYYGNSHSQSGGHMSMDITTGYGPEEYIIRKAPTGLYKIFAHYFRSDALNLNGAITVTVNVFKNYGRSNEEQFTTDVELTHQQGSEFLVGEVVVEELVKKPLQ